MTMHPWVRAFFFVLLSPIILPIILRAKYKWNKGFCRICKSGKFEIVAYDSDKFLSFKYRCTNCTNSYITVERHDAISDIELATKIRDSRIRKLV